MDMTSIIASVVSFILGIGVVYKYVKKATIPLKEIKELIGSIADAVEDGKITAEELKEIIDEADDILPAIKDAVSG